MNASCLGFTFLELLETDFSLAASGFSPDFALAFLCLAVLALAGNALSLAILRRPRFRREHRTLCGQLLLLSVAEVSLTSLFSAWTAFQLLAKAGRWSAAFPRLCARVFVALQWLTDGAVTVRNWSVLLIAAARCESISRPLASLRSPLFALRRLWAAAAAVAVVSLASTALHFFVLRDFATCGAALRVNQRSELVEIVVNFALQRAVPVLLIVATTGVIAATLLRRQDVSGASLRATRTVVALTVVFILLEGVFFVYYVVAAAGAVDVSGIEAGMEQANRVCLMVDSCLNALIYFLSNRAFHTELRDICTWSNRRPVTTASRV